jgi:ATP-dependent RNA helicase RhlE
MMPAGVQYAMTFDDLGLADALLQAAHRRGYPAPTPIQAQAIPAALAGRDVLGCAATGSGKTQAFAWPVLQRFAPSTPRRLHALILVPTRELAAQVAESLRADAAHLAVAPKIVVAFGGVSINPQLMRLRGGADIVVATPGRLLDLVDHNALALGATGILVLDEADRLLDLGFAQELRRILALLPRERQTLCFSATFPRAVRALAGAMQREPLAVDLPPDEDRPENRAAIVQRAFAVDTPRRTQLLLKLIAEHAWPRVLVFVASQYASEHVASKLHVGGGLAAEGFHGDLSQGRRTQLLEDFKAGRLRVLVATDLAARGIDVAQLEAVVNYDLPRSADDYLHRIGRTGRAGAQGLAISFVTPATEAHFRLIEKRQGERVPRETLPGFEPTEAAPPRGAAESPEGTGGVKGRRPSKKDKLRAAAAGKA